MQTDDLPLHFAVFEKEECRDRGNAETGSDAGSFVDIDLGHDCFADIGVGDFVEDRGDHAAGAAPRGPEIDKDRCGSFVDFVVEVAVVEIEDVGAGHGLMRLGLRFG